MRTRTLLLLFLLLDLLLIATSVVIISLYKYGTDYTIWPVKGLLLLLLGSWFVVYIIYIDDFKFLKYRLIKLLRLQTQKFITFLSVSAILIMLLNFDTASRGVFFGTTLLFYTAKIVLAICLFHFLKITNEKNMSPFIIIGNNKIGLEIFQYFKKNTYLGYEPLAILDEQTPPRLNGIVVGGLADFQKLYEQKPFNEAIISVPMSEKEVIEDTIKVAERMGVRPRIVPFFEEKIDKNFKVQLLGDVPTLTLREIPLDQYPNRFWKRAFDIVCTSVGVILLMPLFIIIAIAVKIDSKGPIFYRPIRLGVNNRPFSLYKFRSMVNNDSEVSGTASTVRNDPRVTRLGKFLRKYNLDELPQLFNVLNNEMSLVGPRPHRIYLNRQLQEKMGQYMIRHYIKPGITGWAQVNGWRGPTETKLQYVGRTLHDLWYVENWSFFLDLYIIFLTFFGAKVKKNAF
jgi:putative colanic acid biosysnthesis UDP-glucose lipid carrier transferase